MARATIELLCGTTPDVIFDRIYFSWWAYGDDVAFMPEWISKFARVPDARLVLLTASEEELARRYERKPDLYFSLDVIQKANARFPSLLPSLPRTLPALHIDTTSTPPDEVFERVLGFISPGLTTG
jgi:thymidylate kinase